ncbi:hypothetical protein Aglo03_46880 [Actinokineospora globicatena]|uniref:Uncharacterized protein n=1 Tax=Actinokineospora globicatena TaxID=103729 RepID=A0A9W6VA20_9PSEU|nr:hypothetical protein Aglo03_46880 [Actinokineospora globicatena]
MDFRCARPPAVAAEDARHGHRPGELHAVDPLTAADDACRGRTSPAGDRGQHPDRDPVRGVAPVRTTPSHPAARTACGGAGPVVMGVTGSCPPHLVPARPLS